MSLIEKIAKWMLLYSLLLPLLSLGCGGGGGGGGNDDDETTDGEWNRTSGPTGGMASSIIFDPSVRAGEEIYVAGTGGVFYTSTSGADWNIKNDDLTEPGEAQSLSSVSGTSTIFVGVKNKGVYRSTDGGKSWSSANPTKGTSFPGPSGWDFMALNASATTSYYVGLSNYNGTSDAKVFKVDLNPTEWDGSDISNFQVAPNPSPAPSTKPKKVYTLIRRGGQYELYAGTDVDVYYIDASGGNSNWQDIEIVDYDESRTAKTLFNKVGDKNAKVHSLALVEGASQRDDVVYAGTEGYGLWKYAKDSGNTRWTQVPFDASNSDTIKALVVNTSHRLYAGLLNGGVFLCTNANAASPTFTAKNEFVGSPTTTIPFKSVTSLAVKYNAATYAEDVVYRGGEVYGILFSDDSGSTFHLDDSDHVRNRSLKNTFVNRLIVNKTNKAKAIAATNSGIFTTKSTGNTWERKKSSIHGDNYKASRHLTLATSDYTTYYSSTTTTDTAYSVMYRSDDEGDTWSVDSATDDFNALVSCVAIGGTNDQAYAGTAPATSGGSGNYVWYRVATGDWAIMNKSLNGGGTIPSNIYSIKYVSSTTYLYIGTDDGVYYFDDLSNPTTSKWKQLGALGTTCGALAINSDASVIYAGTTAGFFYYDSSASKWVASNNGLDNDNALMIYEIAPNFDDANSLAYIATADAVYFNENPKAGYSWLVKKAGLPTRHYTVLTVTLFPGTDELRTLYIGTDGGGVFYRYDKNEYK